jgi:alcohol dehydrogenase YqhD (iron-dependent ADH family)
MALQTPSAFSLERYFILDPASREKKQINSEADMNNFQFFNPTRIVFGKNAVDQLAEQLEKHSGGKILFHYGSNSIKKSGLYDKIVKILKDASIEYVELGGVQPNPRLSLVYKGIEICKKENCSFILAAGGGSVIDSAKGIAAGVFTPDDIWSHYLDFSKPIPQALPIGVILTIPAAGSESSPSSVVTNEDGGYKRDIWSEAIIPKFALMDPEITFTLPPYQTACGVADILAHLMERYFSNTEHVDLGDRLSEGTMRSLLVNGPVVMKEPENYAARAEVMWAGTIANTGLLGKGREEDWASHKIEHELSGIYDIAHGAGLAVIFPAWMKYVYKVNKNKFLQFAVRVFDVDMEFSDIDAIINCMIQRLECFFKSLGLPVRLSEMNIDSSRLHEMAQKCFAHSDKMGGFMKLNAGDVEKIYKLAL